MTADAKTILLVEDDAFVALQEARQLEHEGYTVLLVGSGEQAIARARAEASAIDLILMDIQLGAGLDGVEAARIILQDYDIPIVFVSGFSDPDTLARIETLKSYGYVVKKTGRAVLLAAIKTAFKLHAAHCAFHRAEEKLNLVQEASRAGLWDWDIGQDIFTWSLELLKLCGRRAETSGGLASWIETIDPADREAARRRIYEALDRKTELISDYRIALPEGEVRWVRAVGRAYYAGEQPVRMIGLCMDITDWKQMEEKLRQEEEKYRGIFENALEGIFQSTSDGRFLKVNAAMARIYGYASPEEMVALIGNQIATRIYADPTQRLDFVRTLETGTLREFEARTRRKDGSLIWTKTNARAVRGADGAIQYYEGFLQDVTEQKQAEEARQQALAEKEMLMKELQHRVKNSLTTAASLIGLEADNLLDERVRSVLVNTQDRLYAMSALYEQLNRGRRADRTNLSSYLEMLVERLMRAYLATDSPVTIETTLAPLELETASAMPLGLIVNELVTNALKYAFPGGRGGVIRIELEESGEDIMLRVADNGVGMSTATAFPQSSGMGLMLVEMLARQVDGELSFDGRQGVVVTVTFRPSR